MLKLVAIVWNQLAVNTLEAVIDGVVIPQTDTEIEVIIDRSVPPGFVAVIRDVARGGPRGPGPPPPRKKIPWRGVQESNFAPAEIFFLPWWVPLRKSGPP